MFIPKSLNFRENANFVLGWPFLDYYYFSTPQSFPLFHSYLYIYIYTLSDGWLVDTADVKKPLGEILTTKKDNPQEGND